MTRRSGSVFWLSIGHAHFTQFLAVMVTCGDHPVGSLTFKSCFSGFEVLEGIDAKATRKSDFFKD